MRQQADPDVLLRRALSLHESGSIDKAASIFRQLLARFPDHPRLLFLLGSVEAQRGNAAEAVRHLERSLLVDPLNADAYNNLGLALQGLKRVDEALDSFDRASALNPRSAAPHINRGLAMREMGRVQEALESFECAIAIDAGNPEQHNNRGYVLLDLRRAEEALASFDRAIELNPNYAEAFANRGRALDNLGRLPEALASFDRAIALDPKFAEAHCLRGDFLMKFARADEARVSLERAYLLDPKLEFVYPRYLYSRLKTCDWSNIESQLVKLEAKISRGEQMCTPFTALALTGSPAIQRKAAERYANKEFPSRAALGAIPVRQTSERIRLGYYSADYWDHATTRLITELFELHDRKRFELLGFDFGPERNDAMHQRVAASFDRFIDVRRMTDCDVARLSRELQIDIAIDLKGFTADCRPGIFAERAAPIQVNYLGYPGTMGADYIDYIIADGVLIPQASRSFYSEKIVFLPDSYQVNDRRRSVSERSFRRDELDLPAEGFVFCCFNNNYKITPSMFAGWMRILKRVEGSVLWLFEDNGTAAENLRKEAVKRGVRAERLTFARRMTPAEHMARHRNADLFLDTLPYNAHTTASDALWVGLPVLTCPGEAFSSRVAASLLRAIRLPELVANDLREYEALAVRLATNPEELAQIREKLLAHRQTAPLFDTPRFTKHLEAAYSEMHERYLAGLLPDHIVVEP